MARQSADKVPTSYYHPGWGADIQSAVYAYQTAERRDPYMLVTMIDDRLQMDATLKNLVSARTSGIAGCEVSVLPGDDTPEAKESADRFSAHLANLNTYRLLSHHQQDSLLYGWAGSEIQWEVIDGEIVPVDLYHPHGSAYQFDRYGDYLVQVGESRYQVAPPAPDKWIFSRAMENGAAPRGSHGYTSILIQILKGKAYAEWSVAIGRYGIPFLIARIADYTDDSSRANVEDAIMTMGTDNAIIVGQNDGVQFETIDGLSASRSSNSDIHARFLDNCNKELAKLWTGGALTSEGGGQGATYALAREHTGSLYTLLEADAKRLESSFQAGLIEPWARLNSVPGPVPRIRIRVSRVDSPSLAIELSERIHKMGYRVDPNQLSQITGLRIDAPDGESE